MCLHMLSEQHHPSSRCLAVGQKQHGTVVVGQHGSDRREDMGRMLVSMHMRTYTGKGTHTPNSSSVYVTRFIDAIVM